MRDREIIFDTETTGLSPAGGDRMVEIGCIELVGRVETGRTFHAYFNPERSMPSEAEAVHGLSETFLSGQQRFHERVEELIDFLGDAKLVAHNAHFDFGFLNNELGLCRRPAVCMSRMIDTLDIARKKFPGAKHSLDALCGRFGVDRSMRVKHGALLDAELLTQVYIELTGGRQIGLGLDPSPSEPSTVAVAAGIAADPAAPSGPRREPRAHAPTNAEEERHAAFIARIGDALWNAHALPS